MILEKNLFAWASIGEDGKVTGGKAGNQSGSEMRVGYLYDFGQDLCIRCTKKGIRIRGARYAKWIAKNINVGYSQSTRYQLYNLAQACDWDFAKLKKRLKNKKVNTDCSAFASTVINLAFKKRVVGCCTTWTITDAVDGVNQTKLREYFKVITFNSAKKKFLKMDMPLKQGRHIVINV